MSLFVAHEIFGHKPQLASAANEVSRRILQLKIPH
jgi:hypothetical protein